MGIDSVLVIITILGFAKSRAMDFDDPFKGLCISKVKYYYMLGPYGVFFATPMPLIYLHFI